MFTLTYYLVNLWLFLEILIFLSSALQGIHGYCERVRLTFSEDKYHYWLGVIKDLLYPAVLAIVLWLLLEMIRSFRKNRAFDAAIVKGMTRIGYAYLIYAFLSAIIVSFRKVSQMHIFFVDTLLVNIWNMATESFFGLMVLIVAGIFQSGLQVAEKEAVLVYPPCFCTLK